VDINALTLFLEKVYWKKNALATFKFYFYLQ